MVINNYCVTTKCKAIYNPSYVEQRMINSLKMQPIEG